MMETLSLNLLGQIQIAENGRLLSFRTKKAQALLIYLASELGLHRREQLMELKLMTCVKVPSTALKLAWNSKFMTKVVIAA